MTTKEETLKKAREHILAFERDKQRISELDVALYHDACRQATSRALAHPAAIFETMKADSPRRKRLIDSCQFSMQQANMYNIHAIALKE